MKSDQSTNEDKDNDSVKDVKENCCDSQYLNFFEQSHPSQVNYFQQT